MKNNEQKYKPNRFTKHAINLALNHPKIYENAIIIISFNDFGQNEFYTKIKSNKKSVNFQSLLPTSQQINNTEIINTNKYFITKPLISYINSIYLLRSVKSCKFILTIEHEQTKSSMLNQLRSTLNNFAAIFKKLDEDIIESVGILITNTQQSDKVSIEQYKERLKRYFDKNSQLESFGVKILSSIIQNNRIFIFYQNLPNQKQQFFKVMNRCKYCDPKDKICQNHLKKIQNLLEQETQQGTQYSRLTQATNSSKFLKKTQQGFEFKKIFLQYFNKLLNNTLKLINKQTRQRTESIIQRDLLLFDWLQWPQNDKKLSKLSVNEKQNIYSIYDFINNLFCVFSQLWKQQSNIQIIQKIIGLYYQNHYLSKIKILKFFDLISILNSRLKLKCQVIYIREFKQKFEEYITGSLYEFFNIIIASTNHLLNNYKTVNKKYLSQHLKNIKDKFDKLPNLKGKIYQQSNLDDINSQFTKLIISALQIQINDQLNPKQRIKSLLKCYQWSRQLSQYKDNRQHFYNLYQQIGKSLFTLKKYQLVIECYKFAQCYPEAQNISKIQFQRQIRQRNPQFQHFKKHIDNLIEFQSFQEAKRCCKKGLQQLKCKNARTQFINYLKILNNKRQQSELVKKLSQKFDCFNFQNLRNEIQLALG